MKTKNSRNKLRYKLSMPEIANVVTLPDTKENPYMISTLKTERSIKRPLSSKKEVRFYSLPSETRATTQMNSTESFEKLNKRNNSISIFGIKGMKTQ